MNWVPSERLKSAVAAADRAVMATPPNPRLNAFWRILILIVVAVALFVFLSSLAKPGAGTDGLKVFAAAFGVYGTFAQIHLASYEGPAQRVGEDVDAYKKRLRRRDTGDLLAWSALGASVLFVAAAELSEAGFRFSF
jgi:hypothetical protein